MKDQTKLLSAIATGMLSLIFMAAALTLPTIVSVGGGDVKGAQTFIVIAFIASLFMAVVSLVYYLSTCGMKSD